MWRANRRYIYCANSALFVPLVLFKCCPTIFKETWCKYSSWLCSAANRLLFFFQPIKWMMIKKLILPSPFQLTSNYPETAIWYLCGNELRLISSLSLHLTVPSLALALSASCTHFHSEIGCLLPLGHSGAEGEKERKRDGEVLGVRDEDEKKCS